VSATGVRCGNPACGEPINEPRDTSAEARQPCPRCGSTSRTFDVELTSRAIEVSASLETRVTRGINELRLAVVGILVTIGLTVGIGFDSAWWIGVLAGAGSFLLAAGLIAWRRSRHWLMAFMHRITGG
jgi:hypothetical protein